MMAEAQDAHSSEVESPDIWNPPPDREKGPKIGDLIKIYDDIIGFVKQDDYSDDLRKGLEDAFSADVYGGNHQTEPKYLQILEMRRTDLKRIECGITITGETSSGKTSLVNKVVGQKLVTPRILAATSKICRIRNSHVYAIEILDVDGKVLKERTEITDHKGMRKTLDKYTRNSADNAAMYYIDIYCPFRNLDVKGNVMLVDTPGIDGAKAMTSLLMDFLPNALGFIFLIDVSRAGGVEEDRLLAILQNIIDARYKMPCFEPDDVLFVTNKWNMLNFSAKSEAASDSASDDSEDEGEEEIWNSVINKIKRVWLSLTTEQMFRLNLRHEKTDCDTEEERDQFQRFVEVLSQHLEKTKNKKVNMHTSLLFDTICKIQMGILSRIHTATSNDENLDRMLKEKRALLRRLQEKCIEIVEELDENRRKSVEYLSDMLEAYIKSDSGKNEILYPNGKTSPDHSIVGKGDVKCRFQVGITRWMNVNVVHEIEKIDNIFKKRCKEIQLDLETAREAIMGKEGEEENSSLSTILIALITAPLWVPIIIGIGALAIVNMIVFAPLSAFCHAMKGKEIDACYSHCAKQLTKAEIKKILAGVFKNHFEPRIQTVFKKELPREIDSIIHIIDFLMSEKEKIGMNLKAILSLNDSLCKIKDALEKLT